MGSNYFGDSNYNGNERGLSSSSSSSSSSRRGKKSGSSSDKPKQPQRGLGVAQLEKIRLHSQLNYLPHPNPYVSSNFTQEDIRLQTSYSSSSSLSYTSSSGPAYGFQGPHGVMMGLQDIDRPNITYSDSYQTSSIARWHQGNSGFGAEQVVEPNMTRSFFEPGLEDALNKKNKNDRMGSSSQNSGSSTSQEIDLELRLSL